MRLKEIEVRSFKGARHAIVPVRDATVLVGANNAGKSSILQAIHFASRAMAQASEANKQTTLSISELEYLPTNYYRQLGYNSTWGNAAQSPESRISFKFDNEGQELNASVRLKSARNEGLSVNPTIPNALFNHFRSRENVFSAYIPGIAGIPLEEQRITRRHVYKKAASGDSNVVLRNILWLIKENGKFGELLDFIRGVYPGIGLSVNFNEKNDLHISTEVTFPQRSPRPIEFAGTGFLHVVQVFSYLSLFRPSILLIDEPESHLHPTLQTRLTRQLRRRVEELNCVALITTHSPFVARGLSLGSNVVWVKAGGVTEAKESELIKRLLGWGALDKPIILCTEDNNALPLEEIIKQIPELDNKVSVFPFNGVSKLGHGTVLAELRTKLGGNHTIVVHRDRDGRTEDELEEWKNSYNNHNVIPWVTDGSDIESYFCDPSYISCLYGISLEESHNIIQDTINENINSYQSTFSNKRKEVNKKYEKTGGSPVTSDLIDQWPQQRWIKGKDLISDIREKVRNGGIGDEKLIGRANEDFIVGIDLIKILTSIE